MREFSLWYRSIALNAWSFRLAPEFLRPNKALLSNQQGFFVFPRSWPFNQCAAR